MYIKKKFEAKTQNEDEEADDIFVQRKDDAAQRIEHLADIVDSFQPTEKEADQAKLALIDYIRTGLDALISGVEEKMGLKKNV